MYYNSTISKVIYYVKEQHMYTIYLLYDRSIIIFDQIRGVK